MSGSVYLGSVLLALLPLGAEGSRATTRCLSTALEDSQGAFGSTYSQDELLSLRRKAQ